MDAISMWLPGIALAYAATLLGLASPGPNVLAVMGTSMRMGRPSGLALGYGVAAGSFCWAMLTATGLSALLARYASALTAIKLAGGLYLLWLAFKALRSAASRQDVEARTLTNAPRSWVGFFLRGLTVQMTNPKAALSWIAIMSLGLRADAPLWVAGVIVIGTTTLSAVIHTVYALLFSTARMVRIYGKARRSIQTTFGVFFAFAGVKLLTGRV